MTAQLNDKKHKKVLTTRIHKMIEKTVTEEIQIIEEEQKPIESKTPRNLQKTFLEENLPNILLFLHKQAALEKWDTLLASDERIPTLLYLLFKEVAGPLDKKSIEKNLKKIGSNVVFEKIKDFFKIEKNKYSFPLVPKAKNYLIFLYCLQILEKGDEEAKNEVINFILENKKLSIIIDSLKEYYSPIKNEEHVQPLSKMVLPKSLALLNKIAYNAWQKLNDEEAAAVMKQIEAYFLADYHKNNAQGKVQFGESVLLTCSMQWMGFLMVEHVKRTLSREGHIKEKYTLLDYIGKNQQDFFLKLTPELIDNESNNEFQNLTRELNGLLNLILEERIKISPSSSSFSTDIPQEQDQVWISADKEIWRSIVGESQSTHRGGKVFSIGLDDCVKLKENLAKISPVIDKINQEIEKNNAVGLVTKMIWGAHDKEMKVLKEFRDFYLLKNLLDPQYSLKDRLKKFIELRKTKWTQEKIFFENVQFLEKCTNVKTGFLSKEKAKKTSIDAVNIQEEKWPLLQKETITIVDIEEPIKTIEKPFGPISLTWLDETDIKDKALFRTLQNLSEQDIEFQTALTYQAFQFTNGESEKGARNIKNQLIDIDNITDIQDISFLIKNEESGKYKLELPKGLKAILIAFYFSDIFSKDTEGTKRTTEALAFLQNLFPKDVDDLLTLFDKILSRQKSLIANGLKEKIEFIRHSKEVEKEISVILNDNAPKSEGYEFFLYSLDVLEKTFQLPKGFSSTYKDALFLCVTNKIENIFFNDKVRKLNESISEAPSLITVRENKLQPIYLMGATKDKLTLSEFHQYKLNLITQYKDEHGKIKLMLYTINPQGVHQLKKLPDDLLKHFYDFTFTAKPVQADPEIIDGSVYQFIEKQIKETAKPYAIIPTTAKTIELLSEKLEAIKPLIKKVDDKIDECQISMGQRNLFCCFPSSELKINKANAELFLKFKKCVQESVFFAEKGSESEDVLLKQFIDSLKVSKEKVTTRALRDIFQTNSPARAI
jgi:hypothetical protein